MTTAVHIHGYIGDNTSTLPSPLPCSSISTGTAVAMRSVCVRIVQTSESKPHTWDTAIILREYDPVRRELRSRPGATRGSSGKWGKISTITAACAPSSEEHDKLGFIPILDDNDPLFDIPFHQNAAFETKFPSGRGTSKGSQASSSLQRPRITTMRVLMWLKAARDSGLCPPGWTRGIHFLSTLKDVIKMHQKEHALILAHKERILYLYSSSSRRGNGNGNGKTRSSKDAADISGHAIIKNKGDDITNNTNKNQKIVIATADTSCDNNSSALSDASDTSVGCCTATDEVVEQGGRHVYPFTGDNNMFRHSSGSPFLTWGMITTRSGGEG